MAPTGKGRASGALRKRALGATGKRAGAAPDENVLAGTLINIIRVKLRITIYMHNYQKINQLVYEQANGIYLM